MCKWQGIEKLKFAFAQLRMCPGSGHLAPRRGRSRWRHVTRHFIVIAFDRPRAGVNHRHDSLHDGRWISAVTDEIAQQRELRSPTRTGIGDAGVKRLHVGMNIGEERQFHNAGCVRFEKIIRQPLACAGQSWAFG